MSNEDQIDVLFSINLFKNLLANDCSLLLRHSIRFSFRFFDFRGCGTRPA